MTEDVIYRMAGMTVALLNKDSVLKHSTRQELEGQLLKQSLYQVIY
jgi:hypothetical protein